MVFKLVATENSTSGKFTFPGMFVNQKKNSALQMVAVEDG